MIAMGFILFHLHCASAHIILLQLTCSEESHRVASAQAAGFSAAAHMQAAPSGAHAQMASWWPLEQPLADGLTAVCW